ncbi:hypothetical protein BAUCODRAFT_36492 [Baudoinia panamericana UAMH 10762]|uniref:DUF1682-domain-containing protein n=1 Tax=Baudoinia panamericana (strain UAMH 10762) TaxID=717646 RepID=M2MC14_BAUPA|nr:uncharacterized protein BAUCODRAFT_36492 [Baudoinia panamericana UAMH 10762]EMC94021.1 hypothetical protein BAUCODRAFT_36492 [Baudoinia panamericana UAMH 10762]
MADFLQRFLGGAKSSASSISSDFDTDFADFATAASPLAPAHAATPNASPTAAPLFNPLSSSAADRPYTAWYRIWERVTLADFYQELFLLPILLAFIVAHLWGSRANRHRAKQWCAVHLPLLESEYAQIGFVKGKRSPKLAEGEGKEGSVEKKVMGSTDVPDDMLKEANKGVYTTYATGRQNVAFLDVKLTLYPRYNPGKWLAEAVLSFFFDSVPAPVERLEATAYCFDGKEKLLVPSATPGGGSKDSSYDGFVFAIVHKDKMKQLRDDRYDLSLTATKDHPKLPAWCTVMSESAEVTEALVTPELVKAITDAGEDLEALIITDQPTDAPKKLNDTLPKKRITLSTRLRTQPDSTSLFALFLRLPDFLVSTAHFRPEALRKIKATREEEQRKIRKVDEDEKAEAKRVAGDKLKKEERERKLGKLSAEEQRKFLEKEREREGKKGMKRKSMKG